MSTNGNPKIEQLLTALRTELDTRHVDFTGTTPNSVAKRMAEVVPRTAPGNKMAEKVGPFYEASGVQEWLGITRQALQKRRDARTILACRTADKHWIYPVWQFQDDGKLIPGLPEVLRTLATGIDDGWTWALWLQSDVPGQLDGKTAIQWLTDGGDLEPVLQLAANDAAAWVA